jgi:peptidyl-prolyl cis-trans isomerase C
VDRRLEELPEQFRSNYSTPEGRQQLLERMVEERVWWMSAQKAGVPARPQLQRQLEQQKRDLIIRTFVNELMQSNPAPSDSDAARYYDEHRADYRIPATVTLRHLQFKSEADARRALPFARNPKEDWAKLAQKYSLDTLTRASGGQLGTVTLDGVFASIGRQPALAESAFALGEGKLGGPWKTDRGWHLVKVESAKAESFRTLDQVKPMIQRQLGSTRSQEFYRSRLDSLRGAIGVKPDSAAIKNFVSQKKSARDQFKEAQETGPAEARLALYRQLLEQYPNDEVSPQAQFMIGFVNSEELKNYDEADRAFRELLRRYPKSELAASAQWMIDHMRSEEAPAFLDSSGDTLASPASAKRPASWTPPKKGNRSKP